MARPISGALFHFRQRRIFVVDGLSCKKVESGDKVANYELDIREDLCQITISCYNPLMIPFLIRYVFCQIFEAGSLFEHYI